MHDCYRDVWPRDSTSGASCSLNAASISTRMSTKADAAVLFQPLDIAGQGGLADIQCLCSPGIIPVLGEQDRVA